MPRSSYSLILFIFVLSHQWCSAQTPIISESGDGDHESRSFTISRPAILWIECRIDNDDKDSVHSLYVDIMSDEGDATKSVADWDVDLRNSQKRQLQVERRVRIRPGIYYLKIRDIGVSEWKVVLRHEIQRDRFAIKKENDQYLIREIDGGEKFVAMTHSEEWAHRILRLLNAESR